MEATLQLAGMGESASIMEPRKMKYFFREGRSFAKALTGALSLAYSKKAPDKDGAGLGRPNAQADETAYRRYFFVHTLSCLQ